MFTFGIFSTHIPYIAFAVFYAFCLMSGINKASTGDIQWGENYLFIESPSPKTCDKTGADNQFHFHSHPEDGMFSPGFNEFLVLKKRFSPRLFLADDSWQFHFSPVLFSRPPPVFS